MPLMDVFVAQPRFDRLKVACEMLNGSRTRLDNFTPPRICGGRKWQRPDQIHSGSSSGARCSESENHVIMLLQSVPRTGEDFTENEVQSKY